MNTSKFLLGTVVLSFVAIGSACTGATTVSNANTAPPNVNASPSVNANTNTANTTETAGGISAREPERYSATYVISGQTAGQQAAAASTSIEVARNGADRRYALDTRMPGVGQIIFLDRADKRYLILPARKQYFELTQETTGFAVPRSMTPSMMIEQMQRQRGVEQVGEEPLEGRTAIKYRIAGTTSTNTQAGAVSGESFVWVDKETGLPLRAQGASTASGNVQGVSGATATMEIRNLNTNVDPTLFELPQGYTQLTPEQVQQQVKGALAFLQMFMGAMNNSGAGAQPPPAANTSPAASPASH